ncbi:D-alpha,beta-D-heptose 1,7-bisphosphate phosphatase [Desulfuromusa kysingii]|uniref:D,D-heptose 1,7-bisphosphate phosphatase n=1 Tax=Desulfuromusa kysingii TaxID=37625 RepID=A0A1H4CYE4_9BACT|nr:D-glycero-beta-D-manno-heptose 1,7-bisphosphate 7-phosphatase [Desulfuromusa kysingii]SEA65122.1 D-alpha,beta-D-heptose 1,7-bisphosphate phosphatase [Desulfuromusa kysingii]
MTKKYKAIFLDRDGTINVDKGYLYRCDEFSFLPGVPQALKRLQDAGYLLVVVTNQSGVARGYYQMSDVETLHRYMQEQLLGFGVMLAGVYVCPHHPEGVVERFSCDCDCRKGKPGMLLNAAQDLNINLPQSFMVGDKISDLEAGHRAGCCPLLLIDKTANKESLNFPDSCEAVFENLEQVADYVLNFNSI